MNKSHVPFDVRFIWASLAMALLSGFPLGTYVLFRLFSSDRSFGLLPSLIQLHGHIQLVGWVGLFVIGVSLFFIPRFIGVSIQNPRWLNQILWLLVGGLLSQMAAWTLPFLSKHPAMNEIAKILALSGATAEWFGGVSYICVVAALYRQKDPTPHESIRKLRPYFMMVFLGWLIYASVHLWRTAIMIQTDALMIPPVWQQWNADFFIAFVLFPIAYAFSVRTFALFLQLPITIRKPVHAWGFIYLFLTIIAKLFWLPPMLVLMPELSFKLACVGRIARDLFMLWMVWQLHLFYRHEPSPWVPLAVPSPTPPRQGLADAGEFGRFEWAIYSAYGWLVVSLLLDLLGAFSGMFGWGLAIAPDPVRHAFLLGFITLLIIGMASRMLPGFMLRKRIANPVLVGWGCILGNVAAFFRVFPPLLSERWLQSMPELIDFVPKLMVWAGVFGIGAVGTLAWNLAETYRMKEA